ncbi:MAG: peptidoglycan DD-metalloendopeptidase family protein [Candidatus Moraniibacteriota bacterium]|nr:MAG: peptidoglycan DD-metalloendopeptidase family protein [Candidatus Moranbacteria bacterium]
MKAFLGKTVHELLFGFSFLMALSFALSLVPFRNISHAQATRTPEQEDALKKAQNEKEDVLDELKDKIKTYQKIVNLKDKEHDQLAAQAENLAAQSDVLQGDITSNERRLADLGQQIESLESRVKEKEKVIGIQKGILAGILRSYYDSQTQAIGVSSMLLASVDDFDSMILGRDHLFEAGTGVKETLSSITNLRNALVREHDLASTKKVEVASVKFQLEQQNAYLENSRRNKETLAAQAAAEQSKYSDIVSDLEKQRKEIEDEIEQLDAARAGKIDLSSIPNFSSGVLGYPVKDPRKTQGYGKTTFTKWYTFHNGVDFADSVGTPVLAAEDGKVVAMGDEGKYAYGKWIAIEHENGLTTLYGHLSKQSVKKGEKVDRGEKIGLMGSTGYSTGPHVHFGVYTSESFEVVKSSSIKDLLIPTGAHINPEKYL